MTADADLERVLDRLGLPRRPPPTVAGLADTYRAWCVAVPFDNVAKTTALYTKAPGALPGARAEAFFEQWLNDGVGGTCWPTANALFSLVDRLEFDARRVTAAMMDLPDVNHGTVIVRVDDTDYLVDSSMLTHEPLPLVRGQDYIQPGRVNGAEVEAMGDSFRIWLRAPTYREQIPCGLREDNVSEQTFLDAYEASRGFGPFNDRLYLRHEHPRGTTIVAGHRQFDLTADGLTVAPLSAEALLDWMRQVCGISPRAVDSWAHSGCLAASMEPTEPPQRPPFGGVPPSQRV